MNDARSCELLCDSSISHDEYSRVGRMLWARVFSLNLGTVALSPNLLFIGSLERGDLTDPSSSLEKKNIKF